MVEIAVQCHFVHHKSHIDCLMASISLLTALTVARFGLAVTLRNG